MHARLSAVIARSTLGVALALGGLGVAHAADTNRYQSERAACENGSSHQDRATCLQEAGAAKDEARRGNLNDGGAAYGQNASDRCSNLPANQQADCTARLQQGGSTTTRGSVEGGGIIREHRTTEVGTPATR